MRRPENPIIVILDIFLCMNNTLTFSNKSLEMSQINLLELNSDDNAYISSTAQNKNEVVVIDII